MLKIRLRRMGAKKQPFYRIIVADSRSSFNRKNEHGNAVSDIQTNQKENIIGGQKSC